MGHNPENSPFYLPLNTPIRAHTQSAGKWRDRFMRAIIILVQAGILTMMAVIGAQGDSESNKPCPSLTPNAKVECSL